MRCALCLLVLFTASRALAQPDPTQLAGPSLADTPSDQYRFEQFELASEDGERHYRVQLAIPRAQPPKRGFPVLYLLDGNAAFADLAHAQLAQLGAPLVLVAIGYATDLRFDTNARAYDYTPALSEALTAGSVDAARGRRTGGAKLFLRLLSTKIKPEVEVRAKVDARRQTLWGHSYGGLFVLYTLLHEPGSFQGYVAAEPSFWWGDGYLLKHARPGSRRLLLLTGAPNKEPPAKAIDTEAVERMRRARARVPPDAARRFIARRSRAQLCAFEDVAHGRLLKVSLGPTLRFAIDAKSPCDLPRGENK